MSAITTEKSAQYMVRCNMAIENVHTGAKMWVVNRTYIKNEYGPEIEWLNGEKWWYINGILHCKAGDPTQPIHILMHNWITRSRTTPEPTPKTWWQKCKAWVRYV